MDTDTDGEITADEKQLCDSYETDESEGEEECKLTVEEEHLLKLSMKIKEALAQHPEDWASFKAVSDNEDGDTPWLCRSK
jgi:hypothetical protein